MNTQGLPTLDESQICELIRLSEGRSVSYCDSPDWFCGVRKTTHIARDGQTDVEPFVTTCHIDDYIAYVEYGGCPIHDRRMGFLSPPQSKCYCHCKGKSLA